MNVGVHATHCCRRHGCKYGDPDCPVVFNRVKQEYPCEDCGDDPIFPDAKPVTVRQHVLSSHHGLDRVKLSIQKGPLGSFDREDGELLARLWNEYHFGKEEL